jgi:3-deoxy-manno-octulosonate cytidylyltransferase (CMP-KDO synthetase)
VKTLIVIPARLESTRLPQKMLLRETGKPLLQHTWEAASQATRGDDLVVAVDDPQLASAVESFGGTPLMTARSHASGTDRLAEVARMRPGFDLLVNVQGDEPEMNPVNIDAAIDLLAGHSEAHMATLATPLRDPSLLGNAACVKVVIDARGRALYFSRSPIPHPREGVDGALDRHPHTWFQHLGIYVYRRETLLEVSAAPRSPAEQAESLEQLRALHLGKIILVGITEHACRGIDTPEDYREFVSRCRGC